MASCPNERKACRAYFGKPGIHMAAGCPREYRRTIERGTPFKGKYIIDVTSFRSSVLASFLRCLRYTPYTEFFASQRRISPLLSLLLSLCLTLRATFSADNKENEVLRATSGRPAHTFACLLVGGRLQPKPSPVLFSDTCPHSVRVYLPNSAIFKSL